MVGVGGSLHDWKFLVCFNWNVVLMICGIVRLTVMQTVNIFELIVLSTYSNFRLLNCPMLFNFKEQSCQSNSLACLSRLARSQMKKRTPVYSVACVLLVPMPGWLASVRREPGRRLNRMLWRRNKLWINVQIHLLQTCVLLFCIVYLNTI